MDQVIEEMIPRVAADELAAFCDVFCDEGYYTVEQSRRILEAGMGLGLAPKIHADQYSDLGGADLAADLAVVSADHLNFTGAGWSRSGWRVREVVAVLMPLIDFAVSHPRPIRARDWVGCRPRYRSRDGSVSGRLLGQHAARDPVCVPVERTVPGGGAATRRRSEAPGLRTRPTGERSFQAPCGGPAGLGRAFARGNGVPDRTQPRPNVVIKNGKVVV